MKANLEWSSHITKSCLGLVITVQWCSSVANNRIQHPSRHQVANCPARLSWGYSPPTQSFYSLWYRHHGFIAQ